MANSSTYNKLPIHTSQQSKEEVEEFFNIDILDTEADNVITSRSEEDSLNALTNELIQVFNFENINNSLEAQKEELIQRILKLGGNNYTCEDLRRDLLTIEKEDISTSYTSVNR